MNHAEFRLNRQVLSKPNKLHPFDFNIKKTTVSLATC